jgi:hypothetical protein
MAVNLSWPRDYYYGPKFYQQYGPILGVAAVVIVGLVLYYGYQQTRMEVLPEHRADQNVPLSVAMGEPPPIHGGP